MHASHKPTGCLRGLNISPLSPFPQAKGIARQCIVYNCSEQLDYKTMGKLYAGVAQCGCWTCLDEFNRINIEV